MTRQPAALVRVIFSMTGNTKSHLKLFLLQSIHCLNSAVAFFTFKIPFNVPLVVEENVLRHVVHLSPRRGGTGIEIIMFFQNLRMLGNNVRMTVQALFNRRYPRVR